MCCNKEMGEKVEGMGRADGGTGERGADGSSGRRGHGMFVVAKQELQNR